MTRRSASATSSYAVMRDGFVLEGVFDTYAEAATYAAGLRRSYQHTFAVAPCSGAELRSYLRATRILGKENRR